MALDELPGAARSLWLDGPEAAGLGTPPLTADLEADACVIGGGIAGVTTALELARGGRSVVLLERDRVGTGVTGHSTAKLSSLQGSTYSQFERRFGASAAAGYAELNEGAIGYVVDRVQVLGIDCDLRRRPHALFAWTAEQARELDREAAAAARANLDLRRTDDLGLPFAIAGALVRDDQAELQIATYVMALAEALRAAGGQVFEGAVATHVGEGTRPTVRSPGARRSGPEMSSSPPTTRSSTAACSSRVWRRSARTAWRSAARARCPKSWPSRSALPPARCAPRPIPAAPARSCWSSAERAITPGRTATRPRSATKRSGTSRKSTSPRPRRRIAGRRTT